MFRKPLGLVSALALACAPCLAFAANFDVTNPAEFQAALTTAQSNGQNDVIDVAECSGTGCIVVAGVSAYNITSPLTYTAAASESFSLVIDGFDSDTRGLVGASSNGILFIDTTAASGDFAAEIVVKGLTFANGNNIGPPSDGGALYILVNSPRVEVSGSVFGGNAADGNGGALFIQAQSPGELPIQIFDVTFDTNSAGLDGGGAFVAASNSHAIEVFNVSFFDNDAANGGGLKIAGFDPLAIGLSTMSVQLDDFDFYDNIARNGNGGGADIATNDLDVGIGGFVRNIATNGSGGGLNLRSNFLRFFMVNAGFTGNSADINGGAFATESNMGSLVTITNNTIYGNSAVGLGGGVFLTVGGSTGTGSIYNNIIYGNNTDAMSGRDIYIDNDPFSDIPVPIDFFNNDITDLTGFPDSNLYFEIVESSALNSGDNIDGMPLLPLILEIDPSPIQAVGSPTIDAGTLTAPGLPNIDFEGDPRPTAAPGLIDIGMDEFVGGAVPQADLSVTQTDSPDPVTGGNDVTYTVTVTNNGPATATNVTLTSNLNIQLTFVSVTSSQGTCGESSNIVTCQLGDIANGASATATIVAATPVVQTQTDLFNTANTFADETDPDMMDNQFIETTTVVPVVPDSVDLEITKIDTPDPVISGGPTLTYDITVTNNGPDAATGVTVTDTVPVELPIDDATSTVGSCIINGLQVTCTIGDLAVDATATVTIIVSPEPVQASTDFDNTADVTGNEADPIAGNNSSTVTTTVTPPESDMMVTVVATPTSPSIGETVTYDITIMNDGPSDNLGVEMSITLPAMGTFQRSSISQGKCSAPSDGVIDCVIGDMLSGSTVTVQVVFTAPDEAASMVMSAAVLGSAVDPAAGNNTDSDAVSVIEAVDLIIRGTSKGTGSLAWPMLLVLAIAAIASRWRSRQVMATLAVVGLALLGLTLPVTEANAQDDWYVGVSLGDAGLDYSAGDLQQDLSNLGWSINNPSVKESNAAWKAYLGYAFNEYVAVEGGYADLGKVVTQYGVSIPPSQIPAILRDTFNIHPYQGDGWFGAAVFTWPVSPDRFNAYARIGMWGWESNLDVRVISGGSGSITDRESGTDTMYALGVEWQYNEQWSLTAEWERYKLNEWLDVPSIGVRFAF
ncbi:MAG: DUF11 domain-containing protein [Gammaproteobacteria bacterium]|nr:DUF11 domain-containing protein [Gammaproteobacteria bacterium]